jgi:multimeric flavodoxin WrbA
MKVVAYNASPRKQWNTAMLLESALKGAASAGAETELIHLYDLNYHGCRSCLECKRIGGQSYGRCALNDDLSPVLDSFKQADAAIFGSPIYFWDVSGELRSFLERLWFPHVMSKDNEFYSTFPHAVNTLFVYTSNMAKNMLRTAGTSRFLTDNEEISTFLFKGTSSSYYCTETLLCEDYTKYVSDELEAQERSRRRSEVFPIQLIEMFELGKKLTENK